jgi:hypothetical protein
VFGFPRSAAVISRVCHSLMVGRSSADLVSGDVSTSSRLMSVMRGPQHPRDSWARTRDPMGNRLHRLGETLGVIASDEWIRSVAVSVDEVQGLRGIVTAANETGRSGRNRLDA